MPDLTGEWTSVSESCKTTSKGKSCKLTASLTVRNVGNRDAASYVELYLSGNLADTLIKRLSTGKLKAGGSKVLKITYTLPTGQSASGRDIYAIIDADATVQETNEDNNFISYTIPLTL